MNGNIIRSIEDSNCYRMDENGWIFVHVEGFAAVRGFNYGYLLADEILQAITEAKTLIEVQTGVPCLSYSFSCWFKRINIFPISY